MSKQLTALALVAFTAGNGAAVLVNPELVTTLHAPAGGERKNFGGKVQCLINTSDGKFVTVLETCDVVRGMLGKARAP
jgi:hypothetical protein